MLKTSKTDFPTIFVVFGATGDLSRKKLFPALLGLYQKKLLPEKFSIAAFSRRPFSHEEFRAFIEEALSKQSPLPDQHLLKKFFNNVYYVQGAFDDSAGYQNLAESLRKLDQEFGVCSNKSFHLAVPPTFYPSIFKNLSESGLTVPCGPDGGWTRVLVEKPFGNDSKTAYELDKLLGQLFEEEQIFRIDHYLAKEAIQNILAFRFFNPIFEPLWNKDNIESVHILLSESHGVETRGELYEKLGAIRDVGQNHILQMLALIAMKMPDTLNSSLLRRARAKVLKELEPIDAKNYKAQVMLGQCEEFLNTQNVSKDSKTETYFNITTFIDNKRWEGVPFYLESGKWLNENKTEINITFKHSTLVESIGGNALRNMLTFRVQPDEGIKIQFLVKEPGFEMDVVKKDLSFSYGDFASKTFPLAYERVIYDCIQGDQSLFPSTEEIKLAWDFITPIVENAGKAQLRIYKKGSSAKDIV